MKLNSKDITIMGLSTALMIVAGKFLFFISKLLPIPSSRIFITAPVFSFILTSAILITRKIGTVSIISFIYALFMLRFSIFSFLAITLSAVLCDILTIMVFKNYDKLKNIYLSVGFKSFFSVITSFMVIKIFVNNSKFIQSSVIPTILIAIIVYFIGLASSLYCIKLLGRRIEIEKKTICNRT